MWFKAEDWIKDKRKAKEEFNQGKMSHEEYQEIDQKNTINFLNALAEDFKEAQRNGMDLSKAQKIESDYKDKWENV